MQIMFELGPEFVQTVGSLTATGRALRAAAGQGIHQGVQQIASTIGADYLTGQYLKRRTGGLARATQGWMAGELDGVVGVRDQSAVDKYKWLLGDTPEHQPMVIRPKKGRYLTIPLDEAKTAAGNVKAEYAGGLKSIDGGFFMKSKGGSLIFAIRKGKTSRARVRPLFVLVTSVEIYDTGAIIDGVMENLDAVTDAVTARIGEAIQ